MFFNALVKLTFAQFAAIRDINWQALARRAVKASMLAYTRIHSGEVVAIVCQSMSLIVNRTAVMISNS